MATEFISNSWLMPTNANAEANRVSNYSLSFDGSSQYIDLGNVTALQNASVITWNLWVNFNSANYNIVFGKDLVGTTDAIQFYTWASGVGYFFLKTAGTSVTASISSFIGGIVNTGDWNMFTIVFDGSETGNDRLKIYLNGGASNIITGYGGTVPDALPNTTDEFYIGKGLNGDFDGKMTEVSIFDYSLSGSQVLELYGTDSAIGNPMAITNGRKPVAYYPLGNSAFNSEFLVPNGAEQDYVFDFDGSNSISCGNAFTETGAFSVSAWIKTSTTSATSVLYKSGVFQFGKDTWYNGGVGGAPNLSLTDSGGITKLFRNGVAPSGANVTVGTVVDLKDGNWHHIAFTYNGTNQGKYYTDGVVSYTYDITDGSWAGTLASNSNDLLIGKTTVANWNGNVSNISIFSYELPATGTESVESLYNYGTPPNIASYSNLQAWWELDASATFDGSNWSIPDASSNSNTGTSSGMSAANLVQSDLIINQSYDPFSILFDGSNDEIDCGSISQTNEGDISFSAWCNVTASGSYQAILSSTDTSSKAGINIVIRNDGKIKFERNQDTSNTRNNTGYAVGGFSFGSWQHLCGTFNSTSGELKAYVNGELQATSSDTSAGASTTNSLHIGRLSDSSNYPANGKISNVSIYSSELSAAQVKTLYNEHKPFNLNNFEVTPVSWWRLGSVNSSYNSTTSEWTILDEIGTSNGTGSNLGPAQTALSDGVGATGSGLSSGMSSGTNRTGDAPYSDNNSVSYNMSVTAKSTSVPT